MSMLSLHQVSLSVANQCILDQVTCQIESRECIALVGRNGAGKSTLLKLLQGLIVQDKGQLQYRQGLRIAGLAQDVPIDEAETVYHFLVKSLGTVGQVLSRYRTLLAGDDYEALAACQQQLDDLQAWAVLPQVETMATRLGVDLDATMMHLSGGMKRRVLLAAALIAAPDLLLLDEPTNHLDIHAIEWLESYLKNYSGSILVVTHDRAFLKAIATRIIEIDRGQLNTYRCSYETYLDRLEAKRMSEQKQQALFDKRLSDEEAWLRTGVKARRTRNEGRVRALKAMREEFRQRRLQLGKISQIKLDVARSGQMVFEAQHVNYSIAGKPVIQDFSYLLTKGEKVGVIGPNGCGKTTLIRILLNELMPDSGEIRRGTSLDVAYFDQLRRQLDPNKTVMANVADGADHVIIQGKQKHVASYLQDFLFAPECFNQPVSSLSGGECNRLLLAKLFAKPANLLVMDEPTNDLDIESLELLETMLVDYPGTLILISHDRAFINQVVTSIIIHEEDGRFHDYVGGYDDYAQEQKRQPIRQASAIKSKSPRLITQLNFNEQRELTTLPQQIEKTEAMIATLHANMVAPDFYQQEAEKITHHNQVLAENEKKLSELYCRWEELEAKKGVGTC